MKILSTFSPAFDASAKTVDFSLMQSFHIENLYAIINVTRNQAIYIPGAPGLGAASVAGTVITLSYDTSGHDDADQLNIYYDINNHDLIENNQAKEHGGNLEGMNENLSRILIELRVMNNLLKEGLNIKDELWRWRFDMYTMNDEIGNR